MALRDHKPIVIEEFNGLWARGDADSVPIDHFSDCENVQFIQSGFRTRDGLDTLVAQGNVLRMYNYVMQEKGDSLLILDIFGNIYHSLLDGSEITYGPILSIPEMTDFDFHSPNGYAYITPFETVTRLDSIQYQRGLENEFVYVYKGDGSPARKAAGNPPEQDDDNPNFVAYNASIDGVIDQGIHILAMSFSDGADDSTAVGPQVHPVIYAPGLKQAYVQNIPIGGVGVTERKIWMSRAINPDEYVQADADGLSGIYTLYLAKTITDNTTISDIINIADVDLTTTFTPGTLPNPTTGGMSVENTDNEGYCDVGLHIVGVVYETDTGYLTAPGPDVLAVNSYVNENRSVLVSDIPTSLDAFVVKRHLVGSKRIEGYNGDDRGYQLFFIPGGTINDNSTTELEVSYYDIELLEDASHLIDNFAEIPAGVTLTGYHGRMVLTTPHDDISIAYLSAPGEPEAFDQVDGIVIIPLDGNPITTAQEFRDILYIFKQTRTYAVNDNGDVPSTWIPIPIDQGIGASCHGIGTVLDSGGVNIDYLLLVDYSGLMQFNGMFARPELTWKIQDYWLSLDRNFFGDMQICNDSLNQFTYITLPNKRILFADYANGLNAKDIRWAKWRFDVETTTIALYRTDILAIGAEQSVP